MNFFRGVAVAIGLTLVALAGITVLVIAWGQLLLDPAVTGR